MLKHLNQNSQIKIYIINTIVDIIVFLGFYFTVELAFFLPLLFTPLYFPIIYPYFRYPNTYMEAWNKWISYLVKTLLIVAVGYMYIKTEHIVSVDVFNLSMVENPWINNIGTIEGFSYLFLISVIQFVLFLGIIFNIKHIYYLIKYGVKPVYNYSRMKSIIYASLLILVFSIILPNIAEYINY